MKKIVAYFIFLFAISAFSQENTDPPKPVFPIPNQRQLDWMSMEMVSFIHFTTNTFTDLEWGKWRRIRINI